MTLGNYWARFSTAIGELAGGPAGFLLSPGRIREHIEHERLRADRTGQAFSVVNFTVANDSQRRAAIAELSRILRLRLRGSDRAGLLNDGRVCLLLPDTPAEGGRRLAKEIRAMWFASPPLGGAKVAIA